MDKNDRQLLSHTVNDGSFSAFEDMYREYHVKVYFYVHKFIQDTKDIEDVVQNVFIHLWNYREKIDSETPLQAILFKASKQEIALWYRKHRPTYSLEEDRVKENVETLLENDRETLWQSEKMTEILQLIEQLPERRRTIFKLNKLEEKSYGDIALAMNMTTSAVANQISKTLKYLRYHLNNYFW